MIRLSALALVLLIAGCSQAPVESGLSDNLRAAAADMRWAKKSDGRVSVPLRYRAPILVLALPPGRYTSENLRLLLPWPDAQLHVDQWARGRPLTPDGPAMYVLPRRGGESIYFQDSDHIWIPTPIAVWKVDEGALDIVLHREDDGVDITALR